MDFNAKAAEVKALYVDDQFALGVTQESEAYEVGVDRKTISNWRNPKMQQCNLPVAAVPSSLSKRAMLEWLAKECNVALIDYSGEFNGVSIEEIRAIGENFVKLYEESRPKKRKQILQSIANLAHCAIKEEGL